MDASLAGLYLSRHSARIKREMWHMGVNRLSAGETRSIAAWLWTVASLVVLMVVVGGATRLTESGLSITEWRPISGVIPPLTEADWRSEFDNYKQIPQYQALFPDMVLSGFKTLYFWEWGHRLLGRLVGMIFFLPLIWFWLTGKLNRRLKLSLLAILCLGMLQGIVGWWMVQSGLSERIEVSHYFLVAHLLLASLTLAGLVWIATGISGGISADIFAAPRLRRTSSVLLLAVFAQIGLGALVAGLRAGRTYNSWPLMDGHLIPPIAHLATLSPLWRNIIDNITTVQFDHRLLAYGIVAFAAWHAIDAHRYAGTTAVSQRATLLAALAFCQAGIGVVVLLLVVPIWAGLMHQAVAALLLAAATVHRRLLARDRTQFAA
jgi:cytochrome c oxidase assembly protein subunit 15